MTVLKARIGGVWVETDVAGAVRLAGETHTFPPAAGGAVNLMRNPSMKYSASGWSSNSAGWVRATDLPGSMPRTTGWRLVNPAGSGYVRTPATPATPGVQYTASLYLRNFSQFDTTRDVWLAWTRSPGGDSFETTASIFIPGGTVTRISITGTAPANTVSASLIVDTLSPGVDPGVSGWEVTGAMLEEGSSASAYTERDSSVSLFTSQTPVMLDAADGTDNYSLATYMSASVPGTVTAIRWWFPTTGQPGGQAVKARAFDLATSSPLCPETSFATPGTPGTWNQVAVTPFHVDAGQTFAPAIWTPLRYVSASGVASPWPLTNGVLSTPSGAGRFTSGASGNVELPASSFNNGCYFVDCVFVED